jgi:hypothetical protein
LGNLPVKSLFRYRFPMFVFGRAPSFFRWLLWLVELFGRFLPASYGGSVSTDVSDKFAGKIVLYQSAMNPITKIARCKLGKCA